MTLSCDLAYDTYVEVNELTTSKGTEFCMECKQLIPAGTEHYIVRTYTYGEDTLKQKLPCCEECGDLALSILELGYCWSFGDLRSDIAEMKDDL